MVDKKHSILDLLSLKGKIAIITGAASGIGLETANTFAEMGAAVALIDINDKRGCEVTLQISKLGGRAKYFSCDITSDDECKQTVEAIIKE